MNAIFKFLLLLLCLSFWTDNVLASIYGTAEEAKEGLRRGIGRDTKDPFVHSVGRLHVNYKDVEGTEKSKAANGFLVAPDTCVCPGHIFADGKPTLASLTFHPDEPFIISLLDKAVEKGLDPLTIPIEGTKLTLGDVMGNLALDTLQYHPTRDLAVATLRRPLDKVPILPFAIERPRSICAGYLVSYSTVFIRSGSEVVADAKRHLSVLDLRESEVYNKTTGAMEIFLVKNSIVLSKDGKSFSTAHHPCRLFAMTHPGDSGAPFITRDGKILGINYGICTYEDAKGKKYCAIMVIPSYAVHEWLSGLKKS